MQAGRAEVRAVIERAAHRRRHRRPAPQTILFLDEIHRFNKAQQDALLPAVEEGLLTLIGATTENPAFEVNGALLSRTARVRAAGAQRARSSQMVLRRGRRQREGRAARRRCEFLAARSEGDARTALNALELAVATAARAGRGSASTLAARRGRAAAPGRALRQTGRPPLRLHLGLDQGHPRLGPRRLALLPRGDARGRRGPALHRAADGDPRLRGHRQRRPRGALSVATAAARGGRARRPARGALRARPGGDLPVARAQVRRRRARAVGGRRRHVREHGAQPVPGWLRSGPRPGRRTGAATRTPTRTRDTSRRRSCCPRASRGALLRARRGGGASWPSASSGSAGGAGRRSG